MWLATSFNIREWKTTSLGPRTALFSPFTETWRAGLRCWWGWRVGWWGVGSSKHHITPPHILLSPRLFIPSKQSVCSLWSTEEEIYTRFTIATMWWTVKRMFEKDTKSGSIHDHSKSGAKSQHLGKVAQCTQMLLLWFLSIVTLSNKSILV